MVGGETDGTEREEIGTFIDESKWEDWIGVERKRRRAGGKRSKRRKDQEDEEETEGVELVEVALAASKQSLRAHVFCIEKPVSFNDFVSSKYFSEATCRFVAAVEGQISPKS